MMQLYALAGFLSSVSLATAFLPMHHGCSRHEIGNVQHAHHSLAPLNSYTARAASHYNRKTMLASDSGDGSGSGSNDDSIVTGVTLKMAFDSSPVWGVADLSETKSERFTSPESLDMVHRLRRESSVVLVGRGTVERDDCTLTVRRVELGDGEVQPVRVVLDPSLSLIGRDYKMLNDGLPAIIYHLKTEEMDEVLKDASNDSVTLVGLDRSDGRFSMSPSEVIKDLADRGLQHVMVEGGPATARAFIDAGTIDRAILVRAAIEFEIPVPAQIDEDSLKRAGLQMLGTTVMGGDTVEYWTRNGTPWPTSELAMWP